MIYQNVINTLINTNAVTATKYLSPKEIVRATRRRYGNKIKGKQIEITVIIGRPNFREREFIKQCLKAGEKFPVKKIQLKHLPIKKK